MRDEECMENFKFVILIKYHNWQRHPINSPDKSPDILACQEPFTENLLFSLHISPKQDFHRL